MINITEKENCVGCNACVQICPKSCITMHDDEQGFNYPKVDLSLCINCNLCERVCPVINEQPEHIPIGVFAAKNPDKEVLMTSSSGGVFYLLAKYTIDNGGVVFGAKFNEKWGVYHDFTESIDGIRDFQGSKYVQSEIGSSFTKTREFLDSGRKVLFSGTPCQLAALNLFLRKDYGEQLLKVEVICHGVPSPMIWRDYLEYLTHLKDASDDKNSVSLSSKILMSAIADISFRDKSLGWQKYGFRLSSIARQGDQNTVSDFANDKKKTIFFEPLNKNMYLRGFLSNVFLRPSCYECPVRNGKSYSDIILGDFWGVHAYHMKFYDRRGVSLVLINTKHGLQSVEHVCLRVVPTTYETAVAVNPALKNDAVKPDDYKDFWDDYRKNGIYAVERYLSVHKTSFKNRVAIQIKEMVKSVIFPILKFLAK